MAVIVFSPAPDDGLSKQQLLQLAEALARQPQLGELLTRRLREHPFLIVTNEFPVLYALSQHREETAHE